MNHLHSKVTDNILVELFTTLCCMLFLIPWTFSILFSLAEFILVNFISLVMFILIDAFFLIGLLLVPIGIGTVLFIESETQLGLIFIGSGFGISLVAFLISYLYLSLERLTNTLMFILNSSLIGSGMFILIMETGSSYIAGSLILLGVFGFGGWISLSEAII